MSLKLQKDWRGMPGGVLSAGVSGQGEGRKNDEAAARAERNFAVKQAGRPHSTTPDASVRLLSAVQYQNDLA